MLEACILIVAIVILFLSENRNAPPDKTDDYLMEEMKKIIKDKNSEIRHLNQIIKHYERRN